MTFSIYFQSTKLKKVVHWFFNILTIILFFYLVSNLRIIADDYCNSAIVDKYGIWGAFRFYFINWNGFILTNFITSFLFYFFNNISAVYLSIFVFGLLYFLTFILISLFLKFLKSQNKIIIISLTNLYVFILVWNGYNTLIGGLVYNIGWITVAIAWTLPSILFMIYFMWSFNNYSKFILFRKIYIFLLIIFNTILLLFNLQISIILLIYNIFLFIFFGINKKNLSALILWTSIFLFFIVISILILLSPGNSKRSNLFINQISSFRVKDLILNMFQDFMSSLEVILKGNAIIPFICSIIFGFIFKSFIDNTYLKSLILPLVNIMVVTLLINSFLNYFSYSATWHLVPSQLFFNFLIMIFGLWVGTYIIFNKNYLSLLILNLLLVLIIILTHFMNMNNLLVQRKNSWEKGLAVPYDVIGDIEDEWINNCSNDIRGLQINKRKLARSFS